MIKIHQILEGTHELKTNTRGEQYLHPHTGAVTLIETSNQNILVDTGAMGTFPMIKSNLAKLKKTIENIDIVILTHFHLDHAFNISQFQKSVIIGWKHIWENQKTIRISNWDNLHLPAEIKIIETPGHAEEHISIVVSNTEFGTTVISGDAVNEKYYQTKSIKAFSYDDALYHRSAQKILNQANYIIPGHGLPFSV